MNFFSGLRDRMTEAATAAGAGGAAEGASNLASRMFSMALEGADMVKHAVDNTMLGELDREQRQYEEEVMKGKISATTLPWEGLVDECLAKKQILALSLDSRNLLREPPGEVGYTEEQQAAMAVALVQADHNLAKARFQLVPKQLSEEKFWRNYFYRVHLITGRMQRVEKKEEEGDKEEKGETNERKEEAAESTVKGTEPKAEEGPVRNEETKDEEVKETEKAESKEENETMAAAESPANSEQEGTPKKGSPEAADWEADLLADLEGEGYEIVEGKKDKEQWEKDMEDLLK